MSIYLYISLYIYLVRYIYTVPLFSVTGFIWNILLIFGDLPVRLLEFLLLLVAVAVADKHTIQ